MELIGKIKRLETLGVIPPKISHILIEFLYNYLTETQHSSVSEEERVHILERFFELCLEQMKQPFIFSSYHEAIRSPFDYLRFGISMIDPLIQRESSSVEGIEHIENMIAFQKEGGNTILFGNHQTEPDPQIIISLLGQTHRQFAENIIFVAGNRVTTDPMAIPFSLGVNLLCIYSKRYIENPPELKPDKLAHNQHVMNDMKKLLAVGGQCIYVAPSGGRDRPDEKGNIVVSSFEPTSVEMFRLMAHASKQATRFYPLALWTYPLMPPPDRINKELLEQRLVRNSPVHLSFGPPIDMHDVHARYPHLGKHQKREVLAAYVWEQVNSLYQQMLRKRNLT